MSDSKPAPVVEQPARAYTIVHEDQKKDEVKRGMFNIDGHNEMRNYKIGPDGQPIFVE